MLPSYDRGRLAVGVLAMATTILLWASFALTLRGVGGSSLTTADLSMLRFATPVVVLAPWIPRAIREIRAERRTTLALLLLGGLPHFLVSAVGGHLAPAALVGLVIPGTVPLFVTVIAFATVRARIPMRHAASLALIAGGVVAAASLMGDTVPPAGFGVLLAAGFVWAVYTLGLKRSSLSLTSTVLAICAPSALVAVVLAGTGAMPSNLLDGTAQPGDVLLFTVLQGLGTGIVSTIAYTHAVRVLGSGIAATAGALSPVVAAALAVPLLGEPITAGVVTAMAIIVSGVLLFNAPRRRRRTTARATMGDDASLHPTPARARHADAGGALPRGVLLDTRG